MYGHADDGTMTHRPLCANNELSSSWHAQFGHFGKELDSIYVTVWLPVRQCARWPRAVAYFQTKSCKIVSHSVV